MSEPELIDGSRVLDVIENTRRLTEAGYTYEAAMRKATILSLVNFIMRGQKDGRQDT